MEFSDSIWYKLRFITVGLIVAVSVLLLLTIISNTGVFDTSNRVNHVGYQSSDSVDSPNYVTTGMSDFVNEASKTLVAVKARGNTALKATNSAISHGASAVFGGMKYALKGVLTGIKFTAKAAGKALWFMATATSNVIVFAISIPANIFNFVSNTPAVSALIRPAEHVPVPIIDPNSPELAKAQKAIATPKQGEAIAETPSWPLHGAITTKFGVAHWPYQPTHTGLDISDGKRTPIHPFKSGKVITAEWSNQGLGNHVVIDHGNGITSVYGHLSSIAVRVGQIVDQSTVLGNEGTTGVSTGTHLHFEIRVNGQAADPHHFITGQP